MLAFAPGTRALRFAKQAARTSALLLAANLMAGPAHAGWLAKTQVSRVVVHDWGDAVFIYTSTTAVPDPCSGGQNPAILLRSHPQFKEIYAAAMAALMSRSTIGGFASGCDPSHYNLPLLTRIDVLADQSTPYP